MMRHLERFLTGRNPLSIPFRFSLEYLIAQAEIALSCNHDSSFIIQLTISLSIADRLGHVYDQHVSTGAATDERSRINMYVRETSQAEKLPAYIRWKV